MANFSPAASEDDGWWTDDTSTFHNGTAGGSPIAFLYLGPTVSPHNAFIRFPNITIPQGTTILTATLTLTGASEVEATGDVIIFACDEDNSGQMSSAADAAGRAQTTANVPWTTGGCFLNTPQESPDIAAVIQEVIDRAGWESGNALQLLVIDDGLSADISFDGFDSVGTNYAVLEVTYDAPDGAGGGTGSARFNRLLVPRAA
jgi:hypothetical protein